MVLHVATPFVTVAAAHRVVPVVMSENITVPVAAGGEMVAVKVSAPPYVGDVGATARVVVVGIFEIVTDDEVDTTVASVDATTEETDSAVVPALPVAVKARFSGGREAPAAVVPV
jgi:hypothetical protein